MDESMSNDLISRNGFLKELKRYLNRTFLGEVTSSSEISVGELCSLISKLPTAYDPDAVCKNLDKASDYYEMDEQGKEHVQMVNLADAIEIVRNGGKKE